MGLALQLEGNLPFLLCFLYLRAVSKYKPLGGLYLEERFNRRFFAFQVWAPYIILEGLIHGEVYFQNFTVLGYYCYCVNPLSPNSDQHQFSPNNIHALSRD